MIEYDYTFPTGDDAYERLKEDYDKLVAEYIILYNAIMGDLEEAKRIKSHLVDRYVKDGNDLDMRIQSIKQARKRTLKEE